MGQNNKHMLGRDLKFFVVSETSYNPATTAVPIPATTDAMQVLTTSMDYTQERKDRADSRQTRSLLEKITGRKEVTWSCESYIIPRGTATAGAARDDGLLGNDQHVLLRSSFGSSVGSGSGTQYDLTSSQTFPTMTLYREASEVGMESVVGAYVEELKISGSGGDEPKLSWSGTASKYIFTGTSTASSGGTNTMTFTGPDANNFMPGSVMRTTSVSTPARVLTVNAAGTVITTDGGGGSLSYLSELAYPYTPATATSSTAPLNGISGALSLSSATSLPITAFEVTVTNNQKAINDEAFTDSVTDFIPGYRSVTGSITVRARADQMKEIGMRKLFKTRDLTLTLGDSSLGAGYYVTIAFSKIEFDFSAIEIPEAEEATFTLPFTAFGTSGNDEIVLTFT